MMEKFITASKKKWRLTKAKIQQSLMEIKLLVNE